MKIVLAPYCLQIALHRKGGERLSQFFGLIEAPVEGVRIECPDRKLKESDLQECNLLISTTRRKRHPYDADERDIRLITDYVRSGGALLVMSNHLQLTRQDSRLSEKLGFKFLDACFHPISGNEFLILSNFRKPAHSILSHPTVTGRKITVAVNNCSCIELNGEFGTPLLLIDLHRCVASGQFDPANEIVFAIAIDRAENKNLSNHGRIIGISDSGIIGKPTQQNPGPGLEPEDNYYFMQNVLKWLLDI